MTAISEFYTRFGFWRVVICMPFCICLPNFAVIRQRHRSYEVISIFKMAATESEIYLRVQVWWLHSLMRLKSISISNFDEMAQFTTEINLLPVSENGRPPCWNSTSGFDFDVCVVIGTLFCICLPNFVAIGRLAAKLWRSYNDFSKWRP